MNPTTHEADFTWRDPVSPFQLTNAEEVPRDRPFDEQVRLARRMLARCDDDAVIAGAAPFDTEAAGALWVGSPQAVELLDIAPPTTELSPLCEHVDGKRASVSTSAFLASVERALSQINRGVVDKVVLSRAVEVDTGADVDLDAVLSRLARDPSILPFAFRDEGSYVVGASPEVLVSKRGGVVQSGPLAGSAPRRIDRDRDLVTAHNLLKDRKNRDEHSFVVEDIMGRLKSAGTAHHNGPFAFSTDTIWHLKSTIQVDVKSGDTRDSLAFAQLLHPTAAVCGWPRAASRQMIRGLEGRDRGFYTGYVGWQNKRGDGDWRIILRAARLHGRSAILDVGAGIVHESRPHTELAETTLKLLPMLRALGLDA